MASHPGEGSEKLAQRRAGLEYIRAAAEEYAQENGFVLPNIDFSRIVANEKLGREIAAAYEAAPYYDPAAQSAYETFLEETGRQYALLTFPHAAGGLGIQVENQEDDPYRDDGSKVPDLNQMIDDLRNRHLSVLFSEESISQSMDPVTNHMFRVVHDVFGHAATGCGFDPAGEEAAWFAHSHMYTRLARQALTTETRGQQNALLYRHPVYRGNRLYQKYCLLPARFAMLDTITLEHG